MATTVARGAEEREIMQLQNAVALLRVSGPQWDVEAAVKRHQLDAVWWRSGAGERPAKQAGLNLIIADAESASDLARKVTTWLQQKRQLLQQLVPDGGKGRLHITLAVKETPPDVAGMVFDSATLAILADARIELALTSYIRHREAA